MYDLAAQLRRFQSDTVYESAKLTFHGADDFDVYNISVPFEWNGRRYLYGRLERRSNWARSWVRLFEWQHDDVWAAVPEAMPYQLEDPFVSRIGDELVLGGTHVRFSKGKIDTVFGYFYRGRELTDLTYFTTGPAGMKDIRLVELPGGRIGVFSRPKGEDIRSRYGSLSLVGFTIIDRLEELSAEVIASAPYIPHLFGPDEWGGCNQAYYLDSGLIGAIGHIGHETRSAEGELLWAYHNLSFVFDPTTLELHDVRIIGTRASYPSGPAKKPRLAECAFAAGIVMRADGKAELYSGLGDTETGRIVIDDPFREFGRIVDFSKVGD
ncbi:hypothetical protein PA598K_00107 [Paenibacillus sp. 598K]|uniref:DUF1861 family protein n=1 Tax=Paenibacillus sp. 598K TaxID=1117987 RepID=UPI000FF93049|nr:DUF1861 family protein [Paenibacillus sp. 598K]GBF71894.1 hypothetical protein PA598K_00107 [Paenibacillus sp. 598K]